MKKQILELLTAKFPGMRKDGLANLAMSLSLVAKDEETANKLVGELTAEQVEESIKEYRTTADAENAKAIETYRKSHPDPMPAPAKQEPAQSAPQGDMNAEAIAKIVSESLATAMKPVMDRIGVLEGNAVSTSRQSLLENELTEMPSVFKDMVLDNFKNRQFADDESFNQFLQTTKGQVASFRKDMKDSGIRSFGNSTKPQQGGGSDDVSPEVKAFIESRNGNGNSLGGKQI